MKISSYIQYSHPFVYPVTNSFGKQNVKYLTVYTDAHSVILSINKLQMMNIPEYTIMALYRGKGRTAKPAINAKNK